MNENSDSEFKTVSYKRKRRTPNKKGILKLNNSSTESDIDLGEAVRRISIAKAEIFTTDLYASVKASLKEGLESLGNPRISEIICLGLGRIGECLISRFQLAVLLNLSDQFGSKIAVYDPIFSETDKDILRSFEIEILNENLEGKYSINSNKTVLFYMPHCSKQLTNNLIWANWGLNLGHCVVVANSFNKIIESSSTRHVADCANYITKILPYVFEVAIINTFKYYEVFSDIAVHVFPKMNLVCPDVWKDNQEPGYKQNDVEFITKASVENMTSKICTIRQIISELRYVLPEGNLKNNLMLQYVISQFRKYKTTDEQLCKARQEMEFMAKTYLCYLKSTRLSDEIQQEYHGKGERTVSDTAKMVGFKLPHDPK